MEYCLICGSRACQFQIDRHKDWVCEQAIAPERYCNLHGCCHGCECTQASSCPPQCYCDCHKRVIRINNI